MSKLTPTILIILDGWGVAPPSKSNAITLAKKPTLDRLYELYPSTTLGATGEDVGLEKNKRSGSESGHLNIGAGRIVKQDSAYISESITDSSFFKNEALLGAITHALKLKSQLHLMGLMGNTDSPHSDPEHFRAILKLAKQKGIERVFCHLITDGRDSYPKSALENLANFRRIMSEENIGKIATLGGRFYGMDRAKNWDRLTKAYDAMVFAKGEIAQSAEAATQSAYQKNLTDEYILPTVIYEDNHPVATIEPCDVAIFFNLRSDRARQFTKLFAAINKERILTDNMPIMDKIPDLYFTALTSFGPDLNIYTAFPEHTIVDTLPFVLKSIRQLYMAESEKFAHVTYFFNGGHDQPVGSEDRLMVKSPPVSSYADVPEMSAREITQNVVEYIRNQKYDFIAVNYANADMVGHTGNLNATVKAVEFLDEQIKTVVSEMLKLDGNIIITADHGNAEDMFDFEINQPNTFHTKNPVPLIVVSNSLKNKKLKNGGILGNIAPTILDIMQIEKPMLMDKESLLA